MTAETSQRLIKGETYNVRRSNNKYTYVGVVAGLHCFARWANPNVTITRIFIEIDEFAVVGNLVMSRLLMQKTMHFSAWMNAILSTRELLTMAILCAENFYWEKFSCIQKSHANRTLQCAVKRKDSPKFSKFLCHQNLKSFEVLISRNEEYFTDLFSKEGIRNAGRGQEFDTLKELLEAKS